MSLSETLTGLLSVVAEKASLKEEEFFLEIEKELNSLCQEIAAEIGADSAAIFFVSENAFPGGPYMVMRGASGRLKVTYDAYSRQWYQLAKNNHKDKDDFKKFDGFAYNQTARMMGRITNQIWRLEKGINANSNRAFDLLGPYIHRVGIGDSNAYPGINLYTNFRNLIGVPIFIQEGRDIERKHASESEADELYSKYRVIGILKLEGKRPFFMEIPDVEAIRDELDGSVLFSEVQKGELISWCQELWDRDHPIAAAFNDEGKEFPLWLQKEEALQLRKEFVDILTKYCYAEFTRQDMDLLVLWAAQAGRLMIHRIISHAADNRIIISEDELRLLNIHWHDIEGLVTLHQASEAAMRKVRFCLESLKAELDLEKRQTIFGAGDNILVEPRSPIREIESRRKEYNSLIHKLVRKQLQLRETFGEAKHNSQIDSHLPFKDYDINQPLVKRILKDFEIDDLAGIRVIADYESDIDEFFDEFQARMADWGIDKSKEENYLHKAKEGGYRALHVTLEADVRPLMDATDIAILREALQEPDKKHSQPLKIPVEIQFRTAYQHSWAIKTHGILYKREEHITPNLLEQQEILSNILSEADKLSDNVRGSIEDLLLPKDYGERRFLEELKSSISSQGMAVINFSIDCAKQMLNDLLRYNGQSEYSFAIKVCEGLFHNFKVTDPSMFLLILLRNIWRRPLWDSSTTSSGSIRLQCYNILEEHCSSILKHYQRRVCGSPAQTWPDWFGQLPEWLWVMLESYRDYLKQSYKDPELQWKERLQDISVKIYRKFPREESESEAISHKRKEWLERAYMVEAAALLAGLAELPFEPGQILRKRFYNEYLALYREIRAYLPAGDNKDIIIEELDHAFREMSAAQDFPYQPE